MRMTPAIREQVRQAVLPYCKTVWQALKSIYPELGVMPAIVINNRLTKTAGQCFQPENVVELSGNFLLHSKAYQEKMIFQVVPHELIHAADYQLFGKSEKRCGHGSNWKIMMVRFGLDPEPFHDMVL